MEIISIEKKTFEELVSRLGQFVKRMDSINRRRNGRRLSDWMDNQGGDVWNIRLLHQRRA